MPKDLTYRIIVSYADGQFDELPDRHGPGMGMAHLDHLVTEAVKHGWSVVGGMQKYGYRRFDLSGNGRDTQLSYTLQGT